MNNDNIIHEYIYDKRRQLKGIWVAAPSTVNPNVIGIGWALCNTKLGDRFDKDMGYDIAVGRARKVTKQTVPYSLIEGYDFFYGRCKRYFKDKVIA